MAALEARFDEIDTALSVVTADYTTLQELSEEKEALENELLEKMERKEFLDDIVQQSKRR